MTARPFGPGVPPGGAAPPPFMHPFAVFSPYAWMLPPELWNKKKKYAYLELDFVTPKQLPASGTVDNAASVPRDSYFAGVQLTATVTNTDNVTFVDGPSFTCAFKYAGTQIEWSINGLDAPFLNLFGRGSVGDGRFITQVLPTLFDPGSTFSGKLSNLDATARHVRITYHGFRVWD